MKVNVEEAYKTFKIPHTRLKKYPETTENN